MFILKNTFVLILCLASLFIITPIDGAQPRQSFLPYFAGGGVSLSIRNGYYTLTPSIVQRLSIPSLLLKEVSIGKRSQLSRNFLYAVGASFRFGNSYTDTLATPSELEEYRLRQNFRDICFTTDVQHTFYELPENRLLFLLSGIGIHFVKISHQNVALQSNELISLSESAIGEIPTFSSSLQFGIGYESISSKNSGIYLLLYSKVWSPIYYFDGRDLPLEFIDYREIFLSFGIQVKFLFNFIDN